MSIYTKHHLLSISPAASIASPKQPVCLVFIHTSSTTFAVRWTTWTRQNRSVTIKSLISCQIGETKSPSSILIERQYGPGLQSRHRIDTDTFREGHSSESKMARYRHIVCYDHCTGVYKAFIIHEAKINSKQTKDNLGV